MLRQKTIEEWNSLKEEVKLSKEYSKSLEKDLKWERNWWGKWINDHKLIFNRDSENLLGDYEEIFRNMSSVNARLDYTNVNATMPNLERSIAFKEIIRHIYQYYLYK